MVARLKKPETPTSSLERMWEKYGTWITGGAAAVMAVVLVVVLVQRHRESRLTEGAMKLSAINMNAVGATMQLEELQATWGDTPLGPRIRLKLAQTRLRRAEYDEAGKIYRGLDADETLPAFERAQVTLGLAYLAQRKNDPAEARRLWKQVETEKLYAPEARQMLERLDRAEKGAAAGKETTTPGKGDEKKPEGE